jgi:hypothetical protein
MARDVSAPHTEVLEQCRGVGGVLSYAHRRWSVRASNPTALVVSDQLVIVRQRRLWEERHEAVWDEHVDQEHGLSCSAHLVFQLYAVDLRSVHDSSWLGLVVLNPDA